MEKYIQLEARHKSLIKFVNKTLKLFQSYIEYNQQMSWEFQQLQQFSKSFEFELETSLSSELDNDFSVHLEPNYADVKDEFIEPNIEDNPAELTEENFDALIDNDSINNYESFEYDVSSPKPASSTSQQNKIKKKPKLHVNIFRFWSI